LASARSRMNRPAAALPRALLVGLATFVVDVYLC
jgi:hypothetical protein